MSAVDATVAAIVSDVDAQFETLFPVVWPNETFDPEDPPATGPLAGFEDYANHALAQVTFTASAQETHGRTTGGRSRFGELVFYVRTQLGIGPKAATEMAKRFEDRYRALTLLAGEIDFGEPLSEELGEIEGFYVWRTRCPFYQLTTAP